MKWVAFEFYALSPDANQRANIHNEKDCNNPNITAESFKISPVANDSFKGLGCSEPVLIFKLKSVFDPMTVCVVGSLFLNHPPIDNSRVFIQLKADKSSLPYCQLMN